LTVLWPTHVRILMPKGYTLMPLVPGYNFVRASAARAFGEAYRQEYPREAVESVSVIEFLRMIQHKQTPQHRCLQVTGFDRLWNVCEDDQTLGMKIKRLLQPRADWVREHVPYVYFVIPSEVEFVEGATFQLRLPVGEPVDFERHLGRPSQVDRDHYHRPYSLS